MPRATTLPEPPRQARPADPRTPRYGRGRGRAAIADCVLAALRAAEAHSRAAALSDGQIAERAGCRVSDVAAAVFALQKAGHLIIRDPRDRQAGRWLVQPIRGAELADGLDAATRYSNALRARARKLEAQRAAVLEAIAATREAAAGLHQLEMFPTPREAP